MIAMAIVTISSSPRATKRKTQIVDLKRVVKNLTFRAHKPEVVGLNPLY